MKKIETYIINYIGQQSIINTDDIEIYEYGLHLWFLKIYHILCISFIGLVGKEFLNIIIFLLLYSTIRKYAGGYHAKSHIGCYTISIIVAIGVVYFMKNRVSNFEDLIIWSICFCIIWKLVPQDTENRRLDEKEKLLFKKKSKLIFIVYSLLLWFGFAFIRQVIIAVLLVQSVMLVIEVAYNANNS